MATTAAQAGGGKPQAGKGARPTRLNDTTDEPSYVAPGDGPSDTTDPSEFATSVPADKAAAARAGFGAVNAVIPLPNHSTVLGAGARGVGGSEDGEERTERYKAIGPDGKPVTIEHNIETGETRRV